MGYKPSLIVGSLGLTPFIIIFLCCLITPPDQEVYNLLFYFFITYAAIISSFLGGIQWGLITASADKIYNVLLPFFISTVPALIAWSALIFITNILLSLFLVIISYILSLAYDYYLYNSKTAPYWFLSLRVPLTSCVVIVSLAMIFYIG